MKDVSIFIDIHDSNVTINGESSASEREKWGELGIDDIPLEIRELVGLDCTRDECMCEGDSEEDDDEPDELLLEQLAKQLEEIKQRAEEHVVSSELDIKLDAAEQKLELKLEAELSKESTDKIEKVLVYLRKLGMLEDQ